MSSLKIDWFDLAVQATLRSLFQHYSLKASIVWHSAFFTVELSQLSVTTGKTTALSIQTFVSRVMFLLFNTLSKFVIAFLLRSTHLLISRLQSPSTVILESKTRKSVTTSTPFPLLFVMKQWGQMPCSYFFFFFPLIFSFKTAFSLSFFTCIKWFFSSSSLLAIIMVSCAYLRLFMFLLLLLLLTHFSLVRLCATP